MGTKKKAVKQEAPKKIGASQPKKAATKKAATKKAATKKAATKKKAVKQEAPKKIGASQPKKAATKSAGSAPSASGAPAKGGDTGELREGDKAPAFALRDQSGQVVSRKALSKQPYVLYFYPKDSTPGCTTEACGFRDEQRKFERAGVRVLGVSPDSEQSHQNFAKKYELPFSLLSDPDKELAQAYGVWKLKNNYGREYWGIERSTFLVGADGKIKAAWRKVRVPGHVEDVLTAAKGLK